MISGVESRGKGVRALPWAGKVVEEPMERLPKPAEPKESGEVALLAGGELERTLAMEMGETVTDARRA